MYILAISDEMVIDLARVAIMTIIKSAAPLLVVSLVVGLLISVFQTITSIQDQTLTFVPKILSVFITLILVGGWIMNNCRDFLVKVITEMNSFLY